MNSSLKLIYICQILLKELFSIIIQLNWVSIKSLIYRTNINKTTNICHFYFVYCISCYIAIRSDCCKVRGYWVISMSKISIFITSDYYISLVCQFLCLFKIYFLYSCCFVFTCFFKNIAPIVTNFIIIKKRIFMFLF